MKNSTKYLFGILALFATAIAAAFANDFFNVDVLAYFGNPADAATLVGGLVTANIMVPVTSEANGVHRMLTEKYGIKPADITSSYLRRELAISPNNNSYEFDFNRTSVTYPTENNLNRNDLFVVTEIGYFISSVVLARPGTVVLYTYPNKPYFVTEAGTVDNGGLEALYNAKLAIKTGLTETRPIDTHNFRMVPQTQKSSATNYDEQDQDSGFLKSAPRYIFSGNADQKVLLYNVVTTGLATGLTAVTSGYENRVILILKGFNVFNLADYTSSEYQALNDAITRGTL